MTKHGIMNFEDFLEAFKKDKVRREVIFLTNEEYARLDSSDWLNQGRQFILINFKTFKVDSTVYQVIHEVSLGSVILWKPLEKVFCQGLDVAELDSIIVRSTHNWEVVEIFQRLDV